MTETNQQPETPNADPQPVQTTAEPDPVNKLEVPPAPAPTPPVNPLSDKDYIETLFKEYADNGDLKPETYSQLESLGIPKDLIADYVSAKVSSAQHQAQATAAAVYKECGGEDGVQQALLWAQNNLTQDSIDTINTQLASSSLEVVVTTVRGLQARAGAGNVPGKTGHSAADPPYDNEAQWSADMASPKYKTDPAFRAAVDRRLQAAMQLGRIGTGNIIAR